jgi:arabinogalactan endo-1,4-beta-galactosidase
MVPMGRTLTGSSPKRPRGWRGLLLCLVVLTLASSVGTMALLSSHRYDRALEVRGADISYTLMEEATGNRFSDGGVTGPVERILANAGANFIRLRLWVNPSIASGDEASALTLAKRARNSGLKILLDLHYSDHWADSSNQDTPAAWQGQSLSELLTTVREYTRRAVASFAHQGTPVDMVQIGNEVGNGMLWPVGQIYQQTGEDWKGFLQLLAAGLKGAHDGNPRGHRLRTTVHIAEGADNVFCRYFLDHVIAGGVRFDIIGVSYYPFWNGAMAELKSNLDDLAVRYDKPMIVAETAYPWTLDRLDRSAKVSSEAQLPDRDELQPTPEGQRRYFVKLRQVLQAIPGSRGLGFLDWEPEWIPGVPLQPNGGHPFSNVTMFDFDGDALPSIKSAFRPPA